MSDRGSGLAWYRFRTTFGRRRSGYLSVVLLIGLVGGVAMASIAGGRRTQSSYPTFLASTNPSDLTVSIFNPGGGGSVPDLKAQIARLPGVRDVRSVAGPNVLPLTPDGTPRNTFGFVSSVGSTDGLFVRQDKITAIQGRLANPSRPDEVVMTAPAARLLGVHVGQSVPLGFYTDAQENSPGFGTARVPPRVRISAHLVGIVVLNNAVVQDDIDRAYGFIVVTRALLHEITVSSPNAVTPILYGVQLRPGASITQVEREAVELVPQRATYAFHVTSGAVTQVELAIKPESVALGGFGFIAALVCLVLGIQVVSRQLRSFDEEREVLRGLGASPMAAAGDGLIGVVGAVVVGVLLADAVAIGLSPLSPIGPVRPVYPDAGVAFDWLVLGVGTAVLVVILTAAAVVQSYRSAPQRAARVRAVGTDGSFLVRRAESAGVPAAVAVGVRFALEPGRGRTAVPVRAALIGAVVAVGTVVATLTFASSLQTLVTNPPLYGWNWNYALNPTNDVPPAALTLLSRDKDVASFEGVNYTSASIDGQTVPVLVGRPRSALSPPILSGHGLEATNQIVIGQATLAVLHKKIGDTVLLGLGAPRDGPLYVPPTRLRIVGTATFPAVGYSSFVEDHTSMGTGALFSEAALPLSFQRIVTDPDQNLNGPQLVFVKLRPGVSAAVGRANLHGIAAAADKILNADPNAVGNGVDVIGVQRPAQIVNYRSIGSTPVILAIGLAAGAIGALGFTLATSVRRRRRDLALLKALGFTPRQLRAAVVWQATVAAVIGLLVGLPLGIVAGRELWILFADNLNAVPDPTVPALPMLLVALGALVFANLVAAPPGRSAARTSTAVLLRTD